MTLFSCTNWLDNGHIPLLLLPTTEEQQPRRKQAIKCHRGGCTEPARPSPQKLRLYISMRANAMLAEPLKFIARASTMGEKKLVIYVPQEYHKDIMKRWGKRQIKVTLEDAV